MLGKLIACSTAACRRRSRSSFLELVIGAPTQNGVVPPERLFEPPYTDINAQGPTAVFATAQVMYIKSVLDEIRARAVA